MHTMNVKKRYINLYFVFLIFFHRNSSMNHSQSLSLDNNTIYPELLCSKMLCEHFSYSHSNTVLQAFIKSLFAYYVFVMEYIHK